MRARSSEASSRALASVAACSSPPPTLFPVLELRAAALTSTRAIAFRSGSVPAEHRRRTQPCGRVVQPSAPRDRFLRHRAGRLAGSRDAVRHGATQLQGSLYRDVADHAPGRRLRAVNERRYIARRQRDRHLSRGGLERADHVVRRFVAYDTRDNSDRPHQRPRSVRSRGVCRSDIGHHDGLTSYGWLEKEFDARAYAPLGSHRTSLLLRSRAQFKTPADARHQIPFYDLSWLGGRQYLRGYHSYRFRGNNIALVSSELQQTVFAVTGVAGCRSVRLGGYGPGLGQRAFNPRSWQSGLGGGLQYPALARRSPHASKRPQSRARRSSTRRCRAVSSMKIYGKHRFPGRLFIVEGIDGSGKSTQLALLQKWLESEGYGTFFSEWNSSPLVREVTRRGKKKRMLTPMTFSLIHCHRLRRSHRTAHHSAAQGRRAGAGRPLRLHRVRARRRARRRRRAGFATCIDSR